MTVISTLKKNLPFPDNHFTRALKKAGNFLFKNRIHWFILAFTVIYLAVVPGIFARIFVKLGKPVDVKISLPYASPLIHSGIDTTNMVPITNQRVYQINGWAFLENAPDQTIFDKYLVLNSRDQVYYFPYESSNSQMLYDLFKDLGLDVLNSALKAYISADLIDSGSYNIGFLFKRKSGEETYYSYTNSYILRTPNTDSIETGEFPDESMVSVPIPPIVSPQYGAGKELSLDFYTDKQIQAAVDDFTNVTIGGRQYGRLAGWAILQDETDQAKYNRWILLESDQNKLYYPVSFVQSTDLQNLFPELNTNFSGFFVDIFEEALSPGIYEIGVVFQSRTQDANYYAKTPWILTRTSSEFSLGKK